MIIQEPIKATISFALENFAYSDAIFLSERLHAEVATDESLYLLANCYYRSGKPNVAYVLLTEKHTKICHSPQCLFLLSKSCFELKKYNEALDTLTQPFFNNKFSLEKESPKLITRDELVQYYGELSSFVAQLLGSIYVKLDGNTHATHYYALSLKINPFLWNSYEKLVQLDPTAVESCSLLSSDNFEFKYSCGTKPLINLLNPNDALFNTPQPATNHTATLSDNTNTSHTFQTPQQPTIQTSNSPATNLRRSTRLFTHSNWVKENSTNITAKPTKITRTPSKRSRRTISFEKPADKKEESRKSDENLKVVTSIDISKNVKVQRLSASALLELMSKFGSAYKLLAEFKCKEAIEEFQSLPQKHLNTGFVLSSIGRAYFEMGKYDDAIPYFKKCRLLEPYRLQGMEVYSTALWHQQKEVELSCLAQTLIDFDKHAPETWCVAGNCFSLQKEHEISIKFLKRAIQVDPDFFYAYTLLGHELVSADEMDNAMACFRNATRIEPRHYNAWYGIGMIFYKQEKYMHALHNYKRALDISPFNPLLMCHLAIVCHHMKKSKRALDLLQKAAKLDPTNALVKFHRASVNFATENFSAAMDELEQLKQIVPKESMVYFLIGKIHKIHGETHLALMNFSWSMDLDPKGASNQIKELIDHHYGTDDEIMIHSNNPNSGSNANNSTSDFSAANQSLNTTPFQQRATLALAGSGGTPSTSGAVIISGSATSNNLTNGSNNSNNISNGELDPEEADEEEEDEFDEFDNSDLLSSSNLAEGVSFHDNTDDLNGNTEDDFML